jgi:hypothetical protein
MRGLAIAACAVLAVAPVDARTDRFEPGNPWYEEFAVTCRDGDDGMVAECQEGVYLAYRSMNDAQEVTCDFARFWEISDLKMQDEFFPVLPWQYGVEFILMEPGVCTSF